MGIDSYHVEAGAKPMILVLDDDVLSLELYSRELSTDYQVIVCEQVDDARAWIKAHTLAALIVEPAINGSEGWLLLEEIRAVSTPISVIVCSTLDDRKAGLEHGADVFLVKPVLPTTLHRLINQMVLKPNG